MSNIKILLSVPTRGQMHPQTVNSVINLLRDDRYKVDFFISWTGRGVEEARNQMVKYFLKQDADYLLTLDDDVYLQPDKNPLDFVELKKDIVGCPYPVLVNGLEIATYKDGKSYTGKGLEQIDEMGMGCVLISRRVLQGIDAPFSALRTQEGIWQVSEDRSFCQRAKQAGYEVWAHYDYMAHHYMDLDLTKYYVGKHG